MSVILFPSPKKPQYYLSNSKNVIDYFIANFLFSGKATTQLLINIAKTVLPDAFIYILFRNIFHKEDRLPDELSESLNSVIELINRNKEPSYVNFAKNKDMKFIIRQSAWQREGNKFVIILFIDHDKSPFIIAKAGKLNNKKAIELEFNNTKIAYSNLANEDAFIIPEPVLFIATHKIGVYFERVAAGIPINCYLKLLFRVSKKADLYIYALDICKGLLLQLDRERQLLTSRDYEIYFHNPIDHLKNTALGRKYPARLITLKEQANIIQKERLYSVWMHGDLWGGSILYNGKNIWVIDWEFFTQKGVPLWDFFSFAFHIGETIHSGHNISSDFMNYFTHLNISHKIDSLLMYLANSLQVGEKYIPFLFQLYLMHNIQHRDTDTERHWENCLEYYWGLSPAEGDNVNRLL